MLELQKVSVTSEPQKFLLMLGFQTEGILALINSQVVNVNVLQLAVLMLCATKPSRQRQP